MLLIMSSVTPKVLLKKKSIPHSATKSVLVAVLLPWGSFQKAIFATIDLTYLWLILRLPALIFTSVPQNKRKTIVNPAHVQNKILFHLTG